MQNREDIESKAQIYAENECSCFSNDFNGYVNGFEECMNMITEIIKTTPNNTDLGTKLRKLFIEKDLI